MPPRLIPSALSGMARHVSAEEAVPPPLRNSEGGQCRKKRPSSRTTTPPFELSSRRRCRAPVMSWREGSNETLSPRFAAARAAGFARRETLDVPSAPMVSHRMVRRRIHLCHCPNSRGQLFPLRHTNLLCAFAAAMKLAKSGCGSKGRDFSSG